MRLNALILEDLAKSGLDAADAKRAHLRYLNSDETAQVPGAAKVRSYEIPYFGLDGAEKDFFRWKYLDPVTRRDKKGKKRPVKYHQIRSTAPELYVPPEQKMVQLLNDPGLRVGLTEGEKKALKATKDFELTCGLGGIYSYRSKRLQIELLEDLAALARGGREIIITYDGDGHTNRQVRKAEADLAARLTACGGRAWIRRLPPGTALDTILRERGPDEVSKLPISPFDAKAHVSFIRNSNVRAHAKKAAISNVITQDLETRGTYLRTSQNELLYFDHTKHRLIELNNQQTDELRYYMNENYGVNPAEQEYPFVYQDVATAAFERGVKAETHLFSHFDPATQRLYVAASATEVLRFTSNGYERLPNGTDAVYLKVTKQFAPIPDVSPSKDRSAFDYVLRLAHLKRDAKCSRFHLRLLIEVFAIAVIFGNKNLPTRPILLFHGEKGSAKTTEGEGLALTLLGPEAAVTILDPKTPDGLDAVITSQHLAVLDNIDGRFPGIENKLATASTGGSLSRRKLYTTNEEQSFPVRAFLIATTRDPKSFTRDDVVDRLLYMPCDRIGQGRFKAMAGIKARVNRGRAKCWAYFLYVIPKIIVNFSKKHIEARDLRMQDFASFAIAIAEPLGHQPIEIKKALIAGEQEKVNFVAEQSVLPEAVSALYATMCKPPSQNAFSSHQVLEFFRRALTATDLLGYLQEQPGFNRQMTPRTLGTQLRQEWSAIERRVPNMTCQEDKHTKTWNYRFTRHALQRKKNDQMHGQRAPRVSF